jgi:hypothetical protein
MLYQLNGGWVAETRIVSGLTEVISLHAVPWTEAPWTDAELAGLLKVEPLTGAEIVERGLLGG